MGRAEDAEPFFARHPRFFDTSETGAWRDRLEARHRALIEANRDLLAGARVLDLACHDGRFGFAALHAGARHVVGIDVKEHLLTAAEAHYAAYGIDPDRYEFVLGDLYDWLPGAGPFDVVLCFGILYHVNDHMGLLRLVADLDPRAVVIDSNLSTLEGCVVEVRSPLAPGPPPAGSQVEGHPTRAALEAMVGSLGWEAEWFDWAGSGLLGTPYVQDYAKGRRGSLVARCPDHDVAPAERAAMVEEVLAAQESRETQYLTVSLVAAGRGVRPQRLLTWVQAEERRRWRARGFAP